MHRLFPFLILIITVAGTLASENVSQQRVAVREVAEKAKSGDPKAIYDLAVIHDIGYDSIPKDSARSTALYRMAALAGYPPAQNYLGFRYFNGECVAQNIDSALFWLAKAAGNGDAKAAGNLGFLLSNSDAVTRDYPQALKWLSIAADSGIPTGEAMLADLYRQGLGTPADTAKAVTLYNNAIEKGLQDAERKLWAMMGEKWMDLPADSLLSIGLYYYTHRAPGIGLNAFEKVASERNPKALALLGDAYSRGVGVAYDHDKSTAYFLEAALLGDPSAQFIIAELLDIFPDALPDSLPNGISCSLPNGIPEKHTDADHGYNTQICTDSISSARYWYDKASRQGITDAESAFSRLLHP